MNPAPVLDPAYLTPNRYVDCDHPAVQAFAQEHGVGATQREAVVALYYAIRDGFRYNPWNLTFRHEDFTASGVLLRERELGGHCVDKATLLAACTRALGVPSRLHFANVRNHIGTARLEAYLGTDLLVYHGYCELWLGDRWVAATPAFNRQLCERFGVAPLEFNGLEDSVFQEFDHDGGRFMEYVTDLGTHPGLPLDDMIAAWRLHYPMVGSTGTWPKPDGWEANER